MDIKKSVLYFFTEFKGETQDARIALELTKEAMATYRTLLIQKSENRGDRATDNQLQFLEWKQGDFKANQIIMEELNKFGKETIKDLTKSEASHIISRIKGDGK